MSQLILKFESGGSPVRTIKRGNEDIDLDKYIANLEHNFDNWLSSRKLNNKEKDETRKAYQEMILAYNKGDFRPELGGRSVGTSDIITNTTPYKRVQSFFNDVLQKQSAYTKPESTKSKWNNDTFIAELNKLLFNGNEKFNDDFLLKDKLIDGKRGITERARLVSQALNNISSRFGDYDISDTDKENYAKGIAAILKALADGLIEENERMDLSNLGIDVDNYFYTGEKYNRVGEPEVKEKTALEKAQEEAQELLLLRELDELTKQNELSRKRHEYMSLEDPGLSFDFSKYTVTPEDIEYVGTAKTHHELWERNAVNSFLNYLNTHNIYNYDKDWWDKPLSDNFGVKNNYHYKSGDKEWYEIGKDWSNGQLFSRLMDLYAKYAPEADTGSIPRTPEGHFIMQTANGIARVYDPVSRRIYNIASNKVPGLVDAELERKGYTVPSLKLGGALKALFGFKLAVDPRTPEQINRDALKIKDEIKQKETEKRADKTGRTIEEQKIADRKVGDKITTIDKVRMGAIAADLVGAGASFTGLGSVAGGLIGLGSTIANLGADFFDDSISASTMWKNAAIGAGLSSIGLIPTVGGTGMTAKTLAGIVKYAPKILAAVGAGTILLDDNVTESLKKFKDVSISNIANPTEWFKKNNVTLDDLRNLAIAMGAASGLTRMGNNSIKKRVLKRSATPSSNDTYTIKTKDGKTVPLTEDLYNLFNQAKTTTEADAVLHLIRGLQNANTVAAKRFLGKIGKKDKFDKSALTKNKGLKTYTVDPNKELTLLGKIYLGDPNKGYTDAGIIMHLLNNTYHPFSGGLLYKTKNLTTTSTLPTASPKVQIATNYLNDKKTYDLRSRFGASGLDDKSKAFLDKYSPNWENRNYDTDLIKQYLVSIGKIKDTDTINGAALIKNKLVFWQQGGKVLKGLSGLEVPEWFTGRYGNRSKLGNWTPQLSYAKRSGSDIEGFRGDAGSLNTVFSSNQAYTSDHDSITSDIQGYYNKLGGQNFKTAADFVKAYNDSAAKIRGFFDNDVYYQSGNGYNATDATAHNNLFKDMFGSRSIAKGEATGKNLGWDLGMVGQTGSSTWHRRMDLYENEWDGQDLNRVHTIIGADGKPFKVYKKANGDIDILPELPDLLGNPQQNPQLNPQLNGLSGGPQVEVDPESVEERVNRDNLARNYIRLALPWFYGLDRLSGILRTNSKIYDVMRRGIRPKLLDTYERYSPVTGAFSFMQSLNNAAADLRRKFAQPFTSDAHLQLAANLDANKQAREMEKQGFLADDLEIKRTKAEALARVEDNMARRSDVANKNRFSLVDFKREQAQLLADYKLKQRNAKSGWLLEQQLRSEQDLAQWRNFKLSVDVAEAKYKYQAALQPYLDELRAWRRANPTADLASSDIYKRYIAAARQAARDLSNSLFLSMADIYGWPYNPYKEGYVYRDYLT